tara:strand:+ start:293 stop:475 length:183 start_codon:yes stop_codon:yes gene_type:complete
VLVVETCNGTNIVKNQKKPKAAKPRNWIAVHAFQRSGAGKHKSKKTYTRKNKHKGAKYEN